MILYLIIYIFLFVFALMDLVKTPRLVRTFFFVCINIFLILISGLRWKTGGDWTAYRVFYQIFNIDSKFSRYGFEPGYVFLNFLVHDILHGSYTVFLLIFGFLTITLKAIVYKQNVNYIFIAMLLAWGSVTADIFPIRQTLSMAICLLSLPFIEKKKPIAHIVIAIVGVMFHTSSFIWIAAYPIYHLRWGVKWKIILLVLAICIGLGGFIDFIFSVLSNGAIWSRISDKASDYKKIGVEKESAEKSIAIASGILKRAIIFPILFYFEYKFRATDPKFRKYMNLFVFGNMIYFLVINFLALQRMASIFYVFEIILLCRIVQNVPKIKTKFFWFFIIALYALVKLFFIINPANQYAVPYYWIFSDNFDRPWER